MTLEDQSFWLSLVVVPLVVSILANVFTPTLISLYRGTGRTIRERVITSRLKNLEVDVALIVTGQLIYVGLLRSTMAILFSVLSIGFQIIFLVGKRTEIAGISASAPIIMTVLFVFQLASVRAVYSTAKFACHPRGMVRRLRSSLHSDDDAELLKRLDHLEEKLQGAGMNDQPHPVIKIR